MSRELEQTPLISLKGVGEKRSQTLARLGLRNLSDLVSFFPRSYQDRRARTPIASIDVEGVYTLLVRVAKITAHRTSHPKVHRIVADIVDDGGVAQAIWFGNVSIQRALLPNVPMIMYGKVSLSEKGLQVMNPECEPFDQEKKGVSWGAILPVYPLTAGLSARWLRRFMAQTLQQLLPLIEETLPQEILERRELIPLSDAIEGMHFPKSRKHWADARKRLAYQEYYDYQQQLITFRKDVKRNKPALVVPYNVKELEDFKKKLPYKLTNAQDKSISEIMLDISKNERMNRLLQGDVGSGKTVVAIAVAFIVLKNKFNVAMLAPTTLLASQLHGVAEGFLSQHGIKTFFLSGGSSKKERDRILKNIVHGSCFLVGTHALLSEDFNIPQLGLAIIDEQHRFGVKQRAILASNGTPHILTMSGTPIPRTLNLTVHGGIPLSILDKKPASRQHVSTEIIPSQEIERLKIELLKELQSGGQAYWVCPTIGEENQDLSAQKGETFSNLSVEERFVDLKNRYRGIKIAALHGKLPQEEKEEILLNFLKGNVQLLVCTTVIEVGVDVPNATVIVIEGAGQFGLAQLHQLRGRVGRADKAGRCVLLDSLKGERTRQRLEILENCTDGFQIATEDLALRKAGDIRGTRQHGVPEFKLFNLDKDEGLLQWVLEDIYP